MPRVAFIIPTRDRPHELARTLRAIGSLAGADRLGGSEVILADNGSSPPAQAPTTLASGAPVRVIRLDANAGAAARNIAAGETDADWLVMLDDDSHPTDAGLFDAIAGAPGDVAAIGAEIRLGDAWGGGRESGGLPEVFIGCGAAIRREAFTRAGGYDPSFGYYAEEYDLCARLILDGRRIIHDRRFRVVHEKTRAHRSMDHICRRLVRNNAWVAARYAPLSCRRGAIVRDVARYARIAIREDAMTGYGLGFAQMLATIHRQDRRPMPGALWDRFVGLDAVRRAFAQSAVIARRPLVCVVDEGKNARVVDQAIREFGLRTTQSPNAADAVVIGTCSPGPMLDAADRWEADGFTVVTPWAFGLPDARRATPVRPALTLAS